MAGDRGGDLRRLLRERTAAAIEVAARSDGQVPDEQVRDLERLKRLVEIGDATAPSRPRRAWPAAGVLVLTLLIVSLLLFARVGDTEIELDVEATEVAFSLVTREALLRDLGLEALGVSGLKRWDLPEPLASVFPAGLAGDGADEAIHVATAERDGRRGTITIAAVAPPAGTDVWLRHAGVPRQYRLSLRTPGLLLRVDVHGPIVVSVAGMGRHEIDFAAPQAMVLEPVPAPGVAEIAMTFSDGNGRLVSQVPARNLRFVRVAELDDEGGFLVRSLSTIESGTLYFESLNGATRRLRAGEQLRFAAAEGEIRSLGLADDRLALNFHGGVRGMQTGSGDGTRSLMPTWLEWLRARHGLSLLWGSTLYVFGMIMVAARWLGLRWAP